MSSEGGMPGRTVLGQEPQEPHTSWGKAVAKYWANPRDDAGMNEDMVGLDLALDGASIFKGLAMKVLVTVSSARGFILFIQK